MEKIFAEEWIGLRAKVAMSSNPKQIGLEGTIVDEALNSILLKKKDGSEVRLPKKGMGLLVKSSGKEFTIECSLAQFRPEDRTKKLYKKIKC